MVRAALKSRRALASGVDLTFAIGPPVPPRLTGADGDIPQGADPAKSGGRGRSCTGPG